jgi:peptide/nickel transport system permease protein
MSVTDRARNQPDTALVVRLPLGRIARGIRSRPLVTACAAVLVLMALMAIFAPLVAPYNPNHQYGAPFAKPSASHWLGLDDAGEDELSRLIWGARISMLIGAGAATIAMLVGTSAGILGGYFGGWLDLVLVQVTDFFLAVPVIPLMMVAIAVFGRSLTNSIAIIGLLSWMYVMRPVRAEVRSLRERGYVKRVEVLGASRARMIVTHILPHVLPIVVALTVLSIANAVFAEAALAFLGLGDPSVISWGQLIYDAAQSSAVSVGAWWVILPPGIMIACVVLAATGLGQSIENAVNPRLKAAHIGPRAFRVGHRTGPRDGRQSVKGAR